MKSIVDYTNELKDFFASKQALTNTKDSVTSIDITGSTNNTGSTIAKGTFFYLNGTLVKAKTDIANGATLTKDTNYTLATSGGLNVINDELYSITTVRNESVSTQYGNVNFYQFSNGVKAIYFANGTFTATETTIISGNDIPTAWKPAFGQYFSGTDAAEKVRMGYFNSSDGLGMYAGDNAGAYLSILYV